MILDHSDRSDLEAGIQGIVSHQLFVSDIEGAAQTARLIPAKDRFLALALIGRAQALAGKNGAARESIAAALEGARVGITTPAGPGPGRPAVISTRSIPPTDYELTQLAEIQAMAGDVAAALKTVRSIGAVDSRQNAREQVVKARATAGDVAEALDIALEHSRSPLERRDALTSLGQGVATRFLLEPSATPQAR